MPNRSVLRRGSEVLALAIRTRPRPFLLGAVAAALYGAMTVLSATVLGEVTDRVVVASFEAGEVATGTLTLGVVVVLAVALVKSVGVVGRRYGAYLMQYALQSDYRRKVTRQYLALPIAWHRRHSTGQLLSNANADVEAAFFTIAPLPMSIGVGVMLLITAVLLLLTDAFLAGVGFVIWPLLAFVNWYYHRRMEAVATAAQQLRADVSGVAHESIDAALVVKTLGREAAETERFKGWSDQLRDKLIALGRLRAVFDPLVETLPNIGILLVLVVGVWRVESSGLTAGDLVEFAYLFSLLALPIRVFGWMLGEMPRSAVGWDRVEAVLRAASHHEYGEATGSGEGGAGIALDDVSFHHPDVGHANPLARAHAASQEGADRGLTGVSFDVEAGRTIAVVGPTGSGKSTIAALLVRLFDPDVGRVTYDGIDLRDLARPELAEHVAIVFQESFLFDDTVRDNITLGDPFTDEEVERAVRLARAHGFVSALPKGYATRVGERGATLSGGQRQRVALARALVRQPRLLVLDDATSSVDPQVEQEILQGLARADLPSTVIVIAYRRSTIALADEVVFVRNGAIAARGTHEELLADDPEYANLITAYDHREAA